MTNKHPHGTGPYGESLAPGQRAPANYAACAIPSRGREFPEPECPTRGPFQRDRDRVLHSSPFRRLTYKTQVFLFHEGDHYRTRLTHSLEVAQIARTITRQLRLDEDLAEVLALAHDLGHSPFGHAGERALNRTMAEFGGFDHNTQSLRVVTRLERKYRDFDGLNLTWETLEGLAKHNGPVRGGAKDPISRATRGLECWKSLELDRYPSAEAQVAALADDIAYVNHDLDDGLRAGLLKLTDLTEAPLVGEEIKGLCSGPANPHDARTIYELNRRLITKMVADCVAQSRVQLAGLEPQSPNDIRYASEPAIGFTSSLAGEIHALKALLFERVYRHPRVIRVMTGAESIVCDLFQHYSAKPQEMHPQWAQAALGLGERRLARLVSDFVAGMTDRLAIAEHRRLFDVTPELR